MAIDAHVDLINNRRIFYGDGPPTVAGSGFGAAQVGDRIINQYFTTGRPTEWRCIAAGDPGTWESGFVSCQQTITLTNAQVKATNTAPPVILAAQGAGTLIEIVAVIFNNIFLTAAYANGGALALYYGTTSGGVLASATVAATFLTSPVANQAIMVAGALPTALTSAVMNTGLVLANPTADFITGAGSMTVRVIYRVHGGLV